MTCDVYEAGSRKIVGLLLPDPPTPEPGHRVIGYVVERGSGYGVDFGTGLDRLFAAFVSRGPATHEFFAEAVPSGQDAADDTPGRRCEWTEHGWGKWHKA